MPAARERRLPGVRFERVVPPVAGELPRMDVAAFVGFAASGPLDVPVAVDDVPSFEAVFGSDAALAWDPARQERRRAFLAPAVRSFFANGGRRCWVVRVAGPGATANRFPLPGLLECAGADEPLPPLRPAALRASSEGSWSDGLRVGATLRATVLPVNAVQLVPGGLTLRIDPGSPAPPAAGDLLALTWEREEEPPLRLLLPVAAVDLGDDPADVVVTGAPAVWLECGVRPEPAGADPLVARIVAPSGAERTLDVEEVADAPARGGLHRAELAVAPTSGAGPGLEAGVLLRIDGAAGETWLAVDEVRSGDRGGQIAAGAVFRRVAAPSLPAGSPVLERLEVDLWARTGSASPARLGTFGLCPGHAVALLALPTDAERFEAAAPSSRDRLPFTADRDDTSAAARARALVRRAPWPSTPAAPSVYLPLGAAAFPLAFLGAEDTGRAPLERDGLAAFDAALFLDGALRDVGPERLAGEADFLRYQSPDPRPLVGAHALLAIDEATLLAAPDAAQPGWDPVPSSPAPAPPEEPGAAPGEPGAFDACGAELPAASTFAAGPVDAAGTFELTWSAALPEGATFRLDEATEPRFGGAALLARGPDEALRIVGRAPGAHYYQVRVERGERAGPWRRLLVTVPSPGGFVLRRGGAPALLEVQRALLRACAARGDLLAVLPLAEDARTDGAVAHAAALRASEPETAGRAALYHPWLAVMDAGSGAEPRTLPPDGAAAGILARRAADRGAWLAPANELFRGAVALAPRLSRDDWPALLEGGVNLVLPEPRGVVALSAVTASAEAELAPIGVRRLLDLLRRAALRLGTRWVFEPNDGALFRRIQRGLEALLASLHAGGAFAGRTADAAYRVEPSPGAGGLDPDRGRLAVDVKVAPSSPLAFLTLRLVQAGDRPTVTEVR